MEVTKLYDPYFGTTTCATHIAALEIELLRFADEQPLPPPTHTTYTPFRSVI